MHNFFLKLHFFRARNSDHIYYSVKLTDYCQYYFIEVRKYQRYAVRKVLSSLICLPHFWRAKAQSVYRGAVQQPPPGYFGVDRVMERARAPMRTRCCGCGTRVCPGKLICPGRTDTRTCICELSVLIGRMRNLTLCMEHTLGSTFSARK